MIETSQDILYVTVSICIALFTGFLVWIMYYIVQITKQSNEMITDFRQKMEELDATVHELKDKVSTSIDSISAIGKQVSYIMELLQSFGARKAAKRKRKSEE